MVEFMNHLFPNLRMFESRYSKERLLNQRGRVIWFTGLSGSGKSTIAAEVEKQMQEKGFFVAVLDGDNVRIGINSNLGFSEIDRTENIRRIAEVAKLFAENGVIVLCCFVSPLAEQRNLAKKIIGENDFIEIFVDTALIECERRDVKGLYAKARKGEVKYFTGISAPFEAPLQPQINLKTEGKSIDELAHIVLNYILSEK